MKLALTVLPFVALMTAGVAHAEYDDGEEYYVGDITNNIQILSQQAQQKEDRLAILAQKLSSDNVITITNVYADNGAIGNGLLAVRPITSKARMSSGFGYRIHPVTGKRQMHAGMDFAAPIGTPIYATGNGVVTVSGWGNGYGRYIEIDHGNGVKTRYAHNSANLVNVGDTVYANQHIANVGNTGRSTGAHLHYEVRMNGQAVNPQTYLALAPER